jgi:hypothetical protein
MIKQSWTWAKLTEKEREKFSELLEHPCSAVVIKGNYEQRWEACEALYHTYLEGLEYDPLHWREDIMCQPTKTTHYEINYKVNGKPEKPITITDKMQAIRFADILKQNSFNTNVTITQINIITSKVEVK